LGLIGCCDMAIAAVAAHFCLSEVRIGLAPAATSPSVVQASGERATRRYTLPAERFHGHRSQPNGLVPEGYPAAEPPHHTHPPADNQRPRSPRRSRQAPRGRRAGHAARTGCRFA
ncbi:gamma-carboxygeranoyl-CoA hydratase, partial [Pseudomonas syringae]